MPPLSLRDERWLRIRASRPLSAQTDVLLSRGRHLTLPPDSPSVPAGRHHWKTLQENRGSSLEQRSGFPSLPTQYRLRGLIFFFINFLTKNRKVTIVNTSQLDFNYEIIKEALFLKELRNESFVN